MDLRVYERRLGRRWQINFRISIQYIRKYFNKSESHVYFYFSNINTEILDTSANTFEYPEPSIKSVRWIISLGCLEDNNGADGKWLPQETFTFMLPISLSTSTILAIDAIYQEDICYTIVLKQNTNILNT